MAADRIIEDPDGNLVVQQSLASKLDSIQAGQTAGFAEMRTAIAGKADRSDMARIDGDLVSLTIRVTAIETNQNEEKSARAALEAHRAQRFTRKEKVWGMIAALVLIVATFCGPLIANAIH